MRPIVEILRGVAVMAVISALYFGVSGPDRPSQLVFWLALGVGGADFIRGGSRMAMSIGRENT